MADQFKVFDLVQPIGMFATLTYCALLAKACEEKDIEPYIIASSPYYLSPSRGINWFGYFFGHNRLQFSDRELYKLREMNEIKIIRSRAEINEFARGLETREITNEFTSFSEAPRLFNKYFNIKGEIIDCIEKFVDSNFDGRRQLGIHLRGTDHHSEYKFVDYSLLTDAASEFFGDFSSIFIATDEQSFFDFAKSRFGEKKICSFKPEPPSPHTINQEDNYQKGFHALADCLLLSRCQAMIKTPSALSTWSRVFASNIDLVLVGKPYSNPWKHVSPWYNLTGLGYFPESLLYRWEPAIMAENRVLAIIADPPEAPG